MKTTLKTLTAYVIIGLVLIGIGAYGTIMLTLFALSKVIGYVEPLIK
jgi:hypothetical protein